jgi:hypothetical protein
MSVSPLLNAAGRRRSPVTLPGYLAGRPPRNTRLTNHTSADLFPD